MVAQLSDSPDFFIVSAGHEHIEAIASLAEQAGMGVLSDRGSSFVAVEGLTEGIAASRDDARTPDGTAGRVLGFVRIVRSLGHDYVCPIVVAPDAQGRGVGMALMDFAHRRFGTLRFVARGNAVPFYESLGCRETSWSDITMDISSDCVDCPDKAGCAPQPMVWD